MALICLMTSCTIQSGVEAPADIPHNFFSLNHSFFNSFSFSIKQLSGHHFLVILCSCLYLMSVFHNYNHDISSFLLKSFWCILGFQNVAIYHIGMILLYLFMVLILGGGLPILLKGKFLSRFGGRLVWWQQTCHFLDFQRVNFLSRLLFFFKLLMLYLYLFALLYKHPFNLWMGFNLQRLIIEQSSWLIFSTIC